MDSKEVKQGLKPGTLLRGKTYRIERILGQGGFGITYLATDLSLDLKVAIKEFFPKEYCDRDSTTSHVTLGTSSMAEFVERLKSKFLKEARNIAKLKYPSIIRILAAFEENNTAYYVMEYIEGSTLSEMVKRSGPIGTSEALEYIEKVGEALEYIHGKKLNHLDVKPANVIIRNSDHEPILIDFGLSKQYDREGHQTSTTPTGISHGYAPYEQYKTGGLKEFSPQTDLYSLAATLYYILTGVVPPEAPELVEEQLTFPEQVPARLVGIISKAMSPRRRQRHETVKDFLMELKREERTEEKPEPEEMPEEGSADTVIPEPQLREEKVKVVSVDVRRETAPENPTFSEVEKSGWKGWYTYSIAIGCVAVAAILIVLFVLPSKTSENRTDKAVAVQETIKAMEDNTDGDGIITVEDAYWDSPFGPSSYSGPIAETDRKQSEIYVPNGRGVPHGRGVARITEGEFKGNVYEGEFVDGEMEGECTYTLNNGDVFKGTFHDNLYEKGRYISKDKGYFEGSFKDGYPDKGTWYDSEGYIL